jgi:hypothetical protein
VTGDDSVHPQQPQPQPRPAHQKNRERQTAAASTPDDAPLQPRRRTLRLTPHACPPQDKTARSTQHTAHPPAAHRAAARHGRLQQRHRQRLHKLLARLGTSAACACAGPLHAAVPVQAHTRQFISSRGNEYFCEIDEEYLTDRFNLTGLNTEVQYYQYALDLVTDVFDFDCDDEMREQIEKSARHLYGLVHARYIVTTRGLAKMVWTPACLDKDHPVGKGTAD